MVTASLEDAQLEGQTLLGGWRLLCIATLRDAVSQLEEEGNLFRRRREEWRLPGPTYAEKWMQGGCGAITFEECCEVMSVTPEIARQKIREYVHKNRRRPLRGWSR